MRLLAALSLVSSLCWVSAVGFAQPSLAGGPLPVPDWLFPLNPPPPANPPPVDDVKPIRTPNSDVAFTAAQLVNLFHAPDWHPESHSPMPQIVARGRPPGVQACGFCHMPKGQGRPENAALAGLPAQYIIQQAADFKSGARHSASGDHYLPSTLMARVAQNVTAADLTEAANYFAAQRLTKRTRVVETVRVPKLKVVGWIYAAAPGGATEPLGQRLLEMTSDPELHEHRAEGQLYVAYTPVGSIARGKSLAGVCGACHGEGLQGVGLIPPLAGRSPTYLLRQLLGFKNGARTGAAGEPMKAVVANLQLNNMIDVAAYAGSLQP